MLIKRFANSVFRSVSLFRDQEKRPLYFISQIQDITVRKEMEGTQNRLNAIMEATTDFVATADINGRVLYYNSSFRKMLGISETEDISTITIPDTHPEWARKLILNEALPTAAQKGVWEGETAFLSRDGREIPASQVIIAHKTSAGEVTYFSTIARDINEIKMLQQKLEEANKKLQLLSQLDGLTNIYNRRYFDKVLHWEWRRGVRKQVSLSLLMIDIDFYKDYNDIYGHQCGDECLKQVAGVLKETLNRPGDVVTRYGGEEFAVILADTDLSGAWVVAGNLRTKVESLKILHTKSKISQYVTVSIGATSGKPSTVSNPEELIRRADKGLYLAKQKGRNRVEIYKPDKNR